MIQTQGNHAAANIEYPMNQNLSQSEEIAEMSDEKLFILCRQFGSSALYWRQKFIGLLPEVNRRMLYEKKGFGSIFEFAKKLAGLSEEQVRMTLNLEKRFEDKPILKSLLVNGEVSINKLSRIVSIATEENQEILAEQVKLLPKDALEILVRDQKAHGALDGESGNQNVFLEPFFGVKSLPGQTKEPQLADDVKNELFELQQKGIDINEMLRIFLQKRKLDIAQEKEEIAADQNDHGQTKKSSRYIPAKIKKLLNKEHGSKCSIKTCTRQAQTIHHTQRFALAGAHDPHYLAPLCKEHHIIAHSIDFKFHNARDTALK